jgi:hypothetical protein
MFYTNCVNIKRCKNFFIFTHCKILSKRLVFLNPAVFYLVSVLFLNAFYSLFCAFYLSSKLSHLLVFDHIYMQGHKKNNIANKF